jgi:hypothetical protein
MGLRREVVAIPLLGGLDTKTDAKLVVPGQLVVCENGEFTKGGSLRKRAGHMATLPELTDGTPITDGIGLAALGDGWILLGRQNAYVHDRNRNAWTSLGAYTPVTHRETEVARVSAQQSNPDLDSVNGVTCVAWEDSRGGIRFSVFDDASGAALLSEVSVGATADFTMPRVTRTGPNLLMTWHNAATDAIEARVVQSANVQAASSASNITLAANASTTAQYDIVSGDEVAHMAFRQDAAVADNCQLVTLNSAGTVLRTVTAYAQVPNVGPVIGWDEANNRVLVAIWTTAGNVLQVGSYDGATLAAIAANVDALAGVVAVAVGPNVHGGASLWSQTASFVQIDHYNASMGTVGLLDQIRRSVLVTAPWFDGYNTMAIVGYAGTATNLEGSYYLMRDDGVVIGRALYGSGHIQSINFPHVKSLGDDQYTVALGFRRQVSANLAKVVGAPGPQTKFTPVFEHRGIQRADLNCNPKLTPVEIDGVLYTNGGWLWSIDGVGAPTEAQMQQFPDMSTAQYASAAGGNLTASSSYSYRWYYEWTDGRGHRVRSMAITNTVSTTGANFQFNITLPTTPYTTTDARSPIAIVGYRTEANTSTFFYRVTSSDPSVAGTNGYVANNVGVSTIAFTDNLSDANLVGREIDYMSRGEVEHVAFDGPTAIGESGNRLWCIGGGERPDRPQYSLLRTDGAAIEANDSFVVTEFPEDGGRKVAVSHLNGIPVVFAERAIYAIEGLGLQNNRENSQPYFVRQLASDVGCTEPRSVLATRDGVYFKSAKGKYLLGQDQVPRYIGAAVEKYNAQDVTGAASVPDTNQCLFLTSDGLALVYDYFYGKWSEYTNHEGSSLAAGRSGFAYLRNDGSMFVRDPEAFTDAGVPYALRWRLAPIRLEDTIQGLWLVRKVQCIGEYRSPHELEVRVFRNREVWPNQIFRWKPDERLDLDLWGSDDIWGDPDSIWGGTSRSTEYAFDQKIKARKVSTIAFEFTDIPGSPPGASYEMTELALEVFIQPGLARLPATRKI